MSIYHLSSLTNLCKIDFLQDYLHVPYQLPIFHKNRRIQKLESCINSGKFKQNHCDKDCPCQIIWEHSIISPDYLAIRQFDFDLLSSVNVLRLGNGCIPFWWYGPETKSWWYINLHANPERTVTFMNLLLLLLLLFCFFCFLVFFLLANEEKNFTLTWTIFLKNVNNIFNGCSFHGQEHYFIKWHF